MLNLKKLTVAILAAFQSCLLVLWLTFILFVSFGMTLLFYSIEYDRTHNVFNALSDALLPNIIYFPGLVAIITILLIFIKYLRNIKLIKRDYIIFIIALLIEIIIFGCIYLVFIKETT